MASREEFNHHHYYLPPELWPEILIRLPVKALVKFRCVSKSWRSLIESPDFALKQMTHNPENTKGHIVTVDGEPVLYEEIKAQIRNGNNYAKIDQVVLGFDSYEKTSVMGCVNGVFCLKFFSSRRLIEIGLSNPSIEKSLRVPLPNICKSNEYANTEDSDESDDDKPHLFVDVSIGYDYVRNDVKLLAIGYPMKHVKGRGYYHTGVPSLAEVYGVSERSWRSIKYGNKEHARSHPWNSSKKVFVNGAVHWALYHKDIGLKCARAVAFDMGKEVFTYLVLPEIGEKGNFVTRDLVVFEELFGVMEMFDSYFNLCVMKEYGVQKSWATLFKVELSLGFNEFMCLNKDGDVFYVKFDAKDKLMSCDVRKPEPWCVTKKEVFRRPYFTDAYVESLFLLG